jgi:hypothetical protein
MHLGTGSLNLCSLLLCLVLLFNCLSLSLLSRQRAPTRSCFQHLQALLGTFPCPLANLAYLLDAILSFEIVQGVQQLQCGVQRWLPNSGPAFHQLSDCICVQESFDSLSQPPFTPVESTRLGFLESERRSNSMRRLRWSSLPPHLNVIDGQASGPK